MIDLGISALDIAVIVAYFAVIMAVGIWTKKLIKSSDDYFMGNRRFGKFLMIVQGFGVGSHSDQPVSVSGASYTDGLAGIWYQWLWLFITPFYWMIAPIFRRLRYVTMADFFEERFGKSLGILYTIIGLIFFCMSTGLMLKGVGITIEGMTDGAVSENVIILGGTVMFVVYGLAGGLIAATVTDTIQGILILALSFMLIPFAIHDAGGITRIHQILPNAMFRLISTHEITLFFIIMVMINGIFAIVAQPINMALGGSAKSEMASRTGWTYGNFMKRIATAAWAFTGIFAVVILGGNLSDHRELVFGMMAGKLLPSGFVGLMIASLLAAVMSTCDAFMVHGSAIYTRNVYLSFVNPDATQNDMLRVGRITSAIIVAGGLLFAFLFPSVIQGLKETWKVMAYLGVAFWFGVMWKGANRYGAWASVLSMIIISVITGNMLNWSLPYQIAAYLPVGILMMGVVSYLTAPEPEEKLHQFYTLLDTPVGKEERLHKANIEIKLEGVSEAKAPPKSLLLAKYFPQGDDVEDGLVLVDLLHLKEKFSWKRYRTDIIGFLAGILIVLVLLGSMLYLAQVGGT